MEQTELGSNSIQRFNPRIHHQNITREGTMVSSGSAIELYSSAFLANKIFDAVISPLIVTDNSEVCGAYVKIWSQVLG